MEFIDIEAKDYDNAIKIARQRYGAAVRIHSFCTTPASFGKKGGCKLKCYLIEEKTQIEKENSNIEKPRSIEAPSEVVAQMRQTLIDNDFSSQLVEKVIGNLVWEDAKDLTEMELRLVNALVDSARVNRDDILHPPKYFVLHGPSAVGKTMSLLKMSMLYSSYIEEASRRNIALLSLGGSSKLNSLCELYDLEIFHAVNPESVRQFVNNDFNNYDLILVDIGEIDEDLENAMLSILPKDNTGHYYCANARYKLSELIYSYERINKKYDLRSAIVTMCDESYTIGNVLSFCSKKDVSLLFFSSGRNMARGFHPANSAYIMSLFHGFSLDFKSIWENADKAGLLD